MIYFKIMYQTYDLKKLTSQPLSEKDSYEPLLQMKVEQQEINTVAVNRQGLSSNFVVFDYATVETRMEQMKRKKIFKDADFWYHKGISSAKKGNTETAIECYKQALKLVRIQVNH